MPGEGAVRNEHYDTEDAYLAAVGRALQVEYEAIASQGFLLQLDCPDLALEHHISFQDRPIGDFLGFVERVVATINVALRNIPREKVRMHVCWGNYEGPHDRDVALETILPLIARMNVGALVLPFANPRHAPGAGGGIKPAIRPGHDADGIAKELSDALDPLGDHFGMLNEIRR